MTSEEAKELVVEAARNWYSNFKRRGGRPRDLDAGGLGLLAALDVLRLTEEHELSEANTVPAPVGELVGTTWGTEASEAAGDRSPASRPTSGS